VGWVIIRLVLTPIEIIRVGCHIRYDSMRQCLRLSFRLLSALDLRLRSYLMLALALRKNVVFRAH
jgi:hypothetical protein